MFFGMGGMGLQVPHEGIFDVGDVFGSGSSGSNGGGGGWGWADSLASIISAGGAAVERVAGAVTGHQGQYNATTQYQPIQQPQVIVRDNSADGSLSLDRTVGNITGFLAQNIVPVGIFVVGLMLFRSGRR